MSTTKIRRILSIVLVFAAVAGVRLVGQTPTDGGRAGGAPPPPGNGTDPDQIAASTSSSAPTAAS